ncbi:MAG: peptidylprolyl isomerase [Deltaproteobacteria bacterium]
MKTYYLLILTLNVLLIAACNKPVASFLVADGANYHAPSTISFINKSEKADSYSWSFGDGTTSELADPTHRFMKSGIYNVELIAKKDKKMSKEEMKLNILPPEKCLVLIETPYGNMEAELFDQTPLHRDNFLKLAEEGFYNDLLFHRVIDGFMIQGGDPESKNAVAGKQLGTGGPGYQIDAEIKPELYHKKGALAAARMGDQVNPQKKSSGSQFYIVQGTKVPEIQLSQMESRKGIKYTDEQKKTYMETGGTPFLDMEYTVFGQVISGFEVIDKIAKARGNSSNRPDENIWMKIKVIH